MAGDEPQFDWAWLVPHFVHPLKVAIIEAMLWINRPVSASELTKSFGGQFDLSLVAYHVKILAKVGAIRKAGDRRVRGVKETFYSIPPERRPDSPDQR